MSERFTKIVATLGPASQDDATIRALLNAGVNIVRLNGSHGSHQEHEARFVQVRRIAAELDHKVGILFDLQGPKIRVANAPENGLQLEAGQEFSITEPGGDGDISIDCPNLVRDCKAGERILIDDGRILATIIDEQNNRLVCRAEDSGVVKLRKGVNFPDSDLKLPALTDKDRADAVFAAEQDADMVALSFVRSASDVEALKTLLSKQPNQPPIVAKIEKPQAMTNLEEILESTWGVMVARGDLGVELAAEEVPMAQKRIIRRAVHWGKPVITATQMLESMTERRRPTRAETSDVANAVLDGTDAVMLSGETAIGNFPVDAVETMHRIIVATERIGETLPAQPARQFSQTNESVANSTAYVAHQLGCKVIVVFTRTGTTARLIARRRVKVPILAFTPDIGTRNCLNLVWGVQAYQIPRAETVDQRVTLLDAALQRDNIARAGDLVAMCMASPKAPAGSTNILIVHEVGSDVDERIPSTLPLK